MRKRFTDSEIEQMSDEMLDKEIARGKAEYARLVKWAKFWDFALVAVLVLFTLFLFSTIIFGAYGQS